eukprot:6245029-Amphidinium_carterae.1
MGVLCVGNVSSGDAMLSQCRDRHHAVQTVCMMHTRFAITNNWPGGNVMNGMLIQKQCALIAFVAGPEIQPRKLPQRGCVKV